MKHLFLRAAASALALTAAIAHAQQPAPSTATPATATATAKPTYGSYGFDAAGMDPSVKPGDDFYLHANGTWAKNTPIPADKSNYGAFNTLDELSRARTRAILETAKDDPDSKIGAAYASYLDTAAVEAKGLAPIKPWLGEIKGVKDKAGYALVAAKAARAGISGPFRFYVGQDDKDPETYILSMSQGGLGLPDRDFYLDEKPEMAKIRAAYVAHLENMLTLAGESDAKARAAALMAFETEIAKVHWTQIDSRDADKTYNKLTLAALQKAAPGFNFAAYFKANGLTPTELLVAQPSAITGEAALIAKAPIGVLKDALLLRSLHAYADKLPDSIANADFAFYGTTLSGTPEREARWKRGVDFLKDSLGEEVGKVYVAQYFPPETKAAMDVLVKNVLAAMGRRIDGLPWMSDTAKARAHKKLAAFTPKIGYPDKWRDYTSLTIQRDDLLGNAMRANQFDFDYNIGKLGKPIYRWEWGMTPMEINAYANFGMVEIVFPAAILQPPFFDPHADPAVNYGGIGAVIGHELSHHFDDQGAKYDETGKLNQWWTEADVAKFKGLTDKLVKQYDAYEPFPGVHVKGAFTLGENIGDLGGLAVALDAYHASLGGKPAPVIDGMTGDQRFFLGWAQVWRRNYREANLRQRLVTDPHAPSQYRADIVRNFDAWYDAFKPAPDGKLSLKPEDRVKIW
ncbi:MULTISPECIES: M13 family metallopeptidase [unclassified Sphingobium]|uniref:M13 family metallopeptidase n=1 Tax=unclassified Sphingobium TaxID=2611147 RepID=UPI000D17ABF1|nr:MULTISPECIES: M13-type metalloendopeptidase [unclassified Sphingobium]PSO12218.1 peptidase M13 [Sphingobium sp. AEW4]TWD08605.1 putative endopeptidase [Sphingobium sp. AEW010]TWD25763.1 putative endopeptidase [Sphingobium sp. AEW013]TWD28401.1 putative endopeptidase [Sphingobium sp. AEW001]